MIARRLGTLVTVVVLLASGTYLLVYLYRWEWNRALVAGIIFVAAEVAVVGTSLLRRLRAIEARLDHELAHAQPSALEHLRATAPEPPRFEWLDPTQMNVFVPVLLGAGVILSLLAHGVERLASSTVTPVNEQRLALRLDALALPAGSLLGTAPVGGIVDVDVARRTTQRPWRTILTRAFGLLVAVFLLAAAIEVVADETQDRDDVPVVTGSVFVELAVHNRFTTRSSVGTAEALFVACRHTIGHRYRASGFTLSDAGTVTFVVQPGFGDHGARRFEGCLEDAQFDRIGASVVRFDQRP